MAKTGKDTIRINKGDTGRPVRPGRDVPDKPIVVKPKDPDNAIDKSFDKDGNIDVLGNGNIDAWMHVFAESWPKTQIPPVPENLNCFIDGQKGIHISFNIPVYDNISYEIQRGVYRALRAPGGARRNITYTTITTIPFKVRAHGKGVMTYFDENITVGQTYYYRVRAVNEAGASAYTESFMIKAEFTFSGFYADVTTDEKKKLIHLRMTPNSNFLYYDIFFMGEKQEINDNTRKVRFEPSKGKSLTTDDLSLYYQDDLISGTDSHVYQMYKTIYYAFVAGNEWGESEQVIAYTDYQDPKRAACQANPSIGEYKAFVFGVDTTSNVTKFTISRKSNNEKDYTVIKSVDLPEVLAYGGFTVRDIAMDSELATAQNNDAKVIDIISDLKVNETYTYKFTAGNDWGSNDYISKPLKFKGHAPIDAPQIKAAAEPPYYDAFNATWPATDNTIYYEIDRSNVFPPTDEPETFSTNTLPYLTIKRVHPEYIASYKVKVRSRNEWGTSAYSDELSFSFTNKTSHNERYGLVYSCFPSEERQDQGIIADGLKDTADVMKEAFKRNGIITTVTTDKTKRQFEETLYNTFRKAAEDSISYIFLHAHGNLGCIFMCRSESDPGDTVSVMYYELRNMLKHIPGTIVLMIEACRSGSAIVYEDYDYGVFHADPRFKVITSCSSEELSQREVHGPSLTSVIWARGIGWDHHMFSGSKLYADKNGDNTVSISELAEYADKENGKTTTVYSPEGDTTPIFGSIYANRK